METSYKVTKLDLLIIQRNYLTVAYLEIPFSQNSYHIETIQLIYFANQLTGFYMIQGFTERYFRIECTRQSITFRLVQHFNLFTIVLSFWYGKYDTMIGLEARKFTMRVNFISTFTNAFALFKSVFVYNILLDDVGYRPVQTTSSRLLDQS